jgi:hypothetical protein
MRTRLQLRSLRALIRRSGDVDARSACRDRAADGRSGQRRRYT